MVYLSSVCSSLLGIVFLSLSLFAFERISCAVVLPERRFLVSRFSIISPLLHLHEVFPVLIVGKCPLFLPWSKQRVGMSWLNLYPPAPTDFSGQADVLFFSEVGLRLPSPLILSACYNLSTAPAVTPLAGSAWKCCDVSLSPWLRFRPGGLVPVGVYSKRRKEKEER